MRMDGQEKNKTYDVIVIGAGVRLQGNCLDTMLELLY